MSPAEKTINRVLALLAKAEGNTTEAEAEALVAKAAELMARDEISEAMLARAKGLDVDEVTTLALTFRGVTSHAQRELFFAVGRACEFKLIQVGEDRRLEGTWVGFKRDLHAAEVLLTSLLIQQATATKAWQAENPAANFYSRFDRDVARRSFMTSFAYEVGNRLTRIRRETARAVAEERGDRRTDVAAAASDDRAEVTDAGQPSVALVLREKTERVNEWYDTKYGHLRRARTSYLSGSASASRQGREAGSRADLGSSKLAGRRELGS